MPRILLPHPGFRRLSRYADSDLGARDRRRVALHLERCARCRAALDRIRRLDVAVRALPADPPAPGVRERILARHAAGETVILPLANPPARNGARRRWSLTAAAGVVLALLAAPFVVPGADLEANRSELVFTPAAPRPGQSVRVAYRGGSLFAGEARLRLRARWLRRDDPPMPGVGRQAAVAELVRGEDGFFHGTLRLPDGVVYGAFAVEDGRGERVDSNGRRLWELLVHGADGRPTLEALAQRQFDHMASNWELGHENARQAAALYPDRVYAWFMLYMIEQASFTGPAADSARARGRTRLAEFDRRLRARGDGLDPGTELGIITRFAAEAGDTARHRYWRGRLLRQAPRSLWGVQERFLDLASVADQDPRRALAMLDSLWRDAGPRPGDFIVTAPALWLALGTGDVDAVRLWADRFSRYAPETDVGAMLTPYPALREEGMARLRARLRALERVDDAVRPLERTVAEERLARGEEAQRVLAGLGAALLESGRRGAALDTLALALRRPGWDAALFRRVAELRLQGGDAAGAAAPLALAAADPLQGAALGDSARVLLGARFGGAEWHERLARARGEMRERVMVHAARRPLPARVRLRDGDGRTVALREAAAGRAVFVAFWYRYCPPSREQIPRLQRVVAALRAQGHAVVTVTEDPTPEFRRYLRENGLTLPVYTDPWGELGRALGAWGTPQYFVLDPAGNVRFGPLRDLTAVPAQMAVAAEMGEPGR